MCIPGVVHLLHIQPPTGVKAVLFKPKSHLQSTRTWQPCKTSVVCCRCGREGCSCNAFPSATQAPGRKVSRPRIQGSYDHIMALHGRPIRCHASAVLRGCGACEGRSVQTDMQEDSLMWLRGSVRRFRSAWCMVFLGGSPHMVRCRGAPDLEN